MIPKVDTFERDIVDEIKRKEASLTEISAASNDVGNTDVDIPKKLPIFIIAVGTFFVICSIGLGALGYFYFTDSLFPPSSQPLPVNQNTVPKTTTEIEKLSPTLATEIGRFIVRVEKKDQGYILTLSEYSPVFAYITRNESSYIEELALLFSPASMTSTTTPVIVQQKAPTILATSSPTVGTTGGTTTKATSTSPKSLGRESSPTSSSTATTRATSSSASTTSQGAVQVILTKPIMPLFSDVTIANQNMRIWTSGNHTVVYAFISNTSVAISNSTEGILALRSAILHQ